ncbi:MAG TPA: enoyl-CoA hydratase/isomerase family protein [Pseudolabrys sp.]|nr:enoyl-CoA hydratase/isomerase family protein [Pseudolabrys sp.]
MIDMKVDGGIAVVTLSHGKVNALDIEFCTALAAKFDELRATDASAVVLTGQGGIFSAGVDLKRLSAGGADYVRAFLPALHRLYDTVFFYPKPVIAAINGHAIAGGAVLAACADRRVMAQGVGRIGVTELQVGVPFPALAFEILRFAVPKRFVAEFTLGAATYDTGVALQKSWTDEVVEPYELLVRTMKIVRHYASLSPSAFAQTKAQIRQGVVDRMALNAAATDKAVTAIWTAPETLQRVADYVAKTLNKN